MKNFIYFIVRIYVQFILKLYLKRTTILGTYPKVGPVLYTSNHPNSFLDGIIMACVNKRPTWSMARGDAFNNPTVAKILDVFKIMPIYRLSEGRENLTKNIDSFHHTDKILENDGQVVIYSEGICVHQDYILPIKKGTGRMVADAWQKEIPMQLIPVAYAYDNYDKFGKNLIISFGNQIHIESFENELNSPAFLNEVCEKVKEGLETALNRNFKKPSFFNNPIYYLGWLVNFPMYLLIVNIAKKRTKGTVFFDSVVVLLLIIGLFFYWLIIFLLIIFLG